MKLKSIRQERARVIIKVLEETTDDRASYKTAIADLPALMRLHGMIGALAKLIGETGESALAIRNDLWKILVALEMQGESTTLKDWVTKLASDHSATYRKTSMTLLEIAQLMKEFAGFYAASDLAESVDEDDS